MRTQTRRTRRPQLSAADKAAARKEWLDLNHEAGRRAMRSITAVREGRMSHYAAARYTNVYVRPLMAAAHEAFLRSE